MTTSINFDGFMPMQWVFAVDPNHPLGESQTLTIKHGQRSVDTSNTVTIEPGVYMFSWDTNMPDTEWKSFYFRDPSNYEVVFANFGSRDPSGRGRVVIPKKSNLRCHTSLGTQLSIPEPVVAVTLLRTAPLANVFET